MFKLPTLLLMHVDKCESNPTQYGRHEGAKSVTMRNLLYFNDALPTA